MASNWKSIDEHKLCFDDNGNMYLNFNGDTHVYDNFKKFYKKNLEKTDAIMDEIVKEISSRIGINVKYKRYDGEGSYKTKKAYYTIDMDDLFKEQEDWELLQSISDNSLLSIKFPETCKNYEDYSYITDKEGIPGLSYSFHSKILSQDTEKYLVIPNITIEKFTVKDPKDLNIDEVEESDDPEDTQLHIDKPKGQIGEHGVAYDEYCDCDYVQPYYPFEFDTCFTDSKTIEVKKWKEKVIDIMVENYQILNNILEMTKPFALEMKKQIILKRKSLQNLKNKLRIALE